MWDDEGDAMIVASEPVGFNDWETSEPLSYDETPPASSASASQSPGNSDYEAWADASDPHSSLGGGSKSQVDASEDPGDETSTGYEPVYSAERELRDLPWTRNVEVRSEKETRDAIDDNVRIELRNGAYCKTHNVALVAFVRN